MSRRRSPRQAITLEHDSVVPAKAAPPPVRTLASSLVEADQNLAALARLLPIVRAISVPEKSGPRLPAMPPSKDELARRLRESNEDWAAHIENVKHGRKPLAQTASPFRPVPVDAIVLITTLLLDVERRISVHAQVCPWPGLMVAVGARAARIRGQLHLITDPVLAAAVASETTHALATARAAVNPARRTRLAGRCPHCHRKTLTMHHGKEPGEEVIRCDHDNDEDCYCAIEDCGCRRGKRHEWWRARGQWDILARLLAAHTDTCPECARPGAFLSA